MQHSAPKANARLRCIGASCARGKEHPSLLARAGAPDDVFHGGRKGFLSSSLRRSVCTHVRELEAAYSRA